MKTLPIDLIFSTWLNVIKKRQSYVVLVIQKALRASIFFFETRKFRFFKKVGLFLCLFAFITLFQSSIGYV